VKSFVNDEYRAMLAQMREQLAVVDEANARLFLFKVSDTPPSGPEEISGHPATAGPHNNKEIA
jgi:hypothetical protein